MSEYGWTSPDAKARSHAAMTGLAMQRPERPCERRTNGCRRLPRLELTEPAVGQDGPPCLNCGQGRYVAGACRRCGTPKPVAA